MIPQKKKTPEEIAALREEMGLPPVAPAVESISHIDEPPAPAPPREIKPKPTHSLRKHDLPLAPAPASSHRTEIPTSRQDQRDINQVRKRQALAALQQPSIDPVTHIRSQTASPFLYVPGYLLAVAAAITTYQGFLYITPAALISLSAIIMLYMAWRKPRSRHHAALLFIVVFLTLAFGTLHYAPLFQNAP